PSHEGIAACEAAGIPHRNIIAMQGPFSREMNEAILRQYHILHLVTKDGGKAGGFAEKRDAAAANGVTLVLIRRPEEDGVSFDEIVSECEEMMTCR
ncbi:MAG: precorrin-6A/cobalt-precorrin-6A reductase, partial [Oscillospiraceae bacterium]|nr:precorrin-6A/cobalt-precorrin-6A reductase [Oscillospiraceae bacterium]